MRFAIEYIGFFVFLYLHCPIYGQTDAYQEYIDNHYKLTGINLSPNGKWITYNKSYDHKEDTLILKNREDSKTFEISEGRNVQFGTGFFELGYLQDNTIFLINNNEKKKFLPHVENYFFLKKRIVIIQKVENTTDILVYDEQGKLLHEVRNTAQYKFNKANTAVIYLNQDQNEINLLDLLNLNSREIFKSGSNFLDSLIWDEKGGNFAFTEISPSGDNHSFHVFDISSDSINHHHIKTLENAEINKGLKAKDNHMRDFYLSKKGDKVFFELFYAVTEKPENSNFYVWKSNKPNAIQESLKPSRDYRRELAVWDLKSQKLIKITDRGYKNAVLVPNSDLVLLYSDKNYQPNFKFKGDFIDFLLKNYLTGEIETKITKQPYDHFVTMVSPAGKYISYFKDQDWWVFDIKNKRHKNLTAKLPHPFYNTAYDWSGIAPPYGSPGWTVGDARMIVYDEYDIYLLSPDGSEVKKITSGRREEMVLRLDKKVNGSKPSKRNFGFRSEAFNLNRKEILSAFNKVTKAQGYFEYNKDQGVQRIIYKEAQIKNLTFSKKNGTYLYLEEKYNKPPKLILINNNRTIDIHQSNPKFRSLGWSKPQLITYKCLGKIQQAILFFPSNYESGKKYPLITSIYEKRSDELFNYVSPSSGKLIGFNIRDYNQDGYFILYPDIAYRKNGPGLSAVKCIKNAVDKALKNNSVSKEKIGLQGHSFGAYQTTFILTKTNVFKTAVASNGFTNLVSWYLSLDEFHNSPMFWRFEWHQQRFRGSYFENKKKYLQNSPVHNAAEINTPLLLWAGKDDEIVNWEQSLQLHFALTRLNKKNIFLLYKKEGHLLLNKENQDDIKDKTKKWFDYYLKNSELPTWME